MGAAAETFMETLAANVDNAKLTDAEFRQFVRNSLPAVKQLSESEGANEIIRSIG